MLMLDENDYSGNEEEVNQTDDDDAEDAANEEGEDVNQNQNQDEEEEENENAGPMNEDENFVAIDSKRMISKI